MEFTCELDLPRDEWHDVWPLFQEQPRGMLVMSYHSNADYERTSKKGLAIVDEPGRVIITSLRSFILVTQLVSTVHFSSAFHGTPGLFILAIKNSANGTPT